MGYRHFDCARIYANESHIGQAFARAIEGGEVQRQELWVTSKLWNDCHQRQHVRPALEQSLNDLKLDYLDLYLMHWPVAHRHGVLHPESSNEILSPDQAPIAEAFLAMEECRAAGLCRNIGVSNFSIVNLNRLISDSGIVPAVNQVESHPYLQQSALLEYQAKQDIVLTAYSPLGSRDRPDSMKQNNEPQLFDHSVIRGIAEKHARTPGQILIAWAIERGTSVIPKSATQQHLHDNFDAASIQLDDEDMRSIGQIDAGFRYVDGTFWELPGSPWTADKIWS